MTILTTLKRTTAIVALAALPLPLAPAAALAESAQATGTQPPAAEQAGQAGQPAATGQGGGAAQTAPGQQAQSGTADQGQPGQTTDPQATQTQGEPGQTGTQSGESPDPAAQGQATGPATGQATQGQDTEATQTQGEPGQTGTQSGQSPEQGAQGQAEAGSAEDLVVAKVGDREIRRSDVLTVIGMLPPQLQQQPPEMLIPIALDQLVMRELILQKAQEAGLENDPEVTALAQDASMRAKEDAMVQVWLNRELGKSVTDEKVQETYDTVKGQLGDQAPTLEVLRPQIEQELRQQAFLDLSQQLQANAEVTLYGPDGQPITQ